MCGIMGFVSGFGGKPDRHTFEKVLADTVTRGTHAWGIAAVDRRGVLHMYKRNGSALKDIDRVWEYAKESTAFILHTRWATHGEKNGLNNHPHSVDGGWLIHNGVVRNYQDLKAQTRGCISECDSEIICRLAEQAPGRLPDRMQAAINRTHGNLAIAALWRKPTCLVIARRGNPLSVGRMSDGLWFSSNGLGFASEPVRQDTLIEYRIKAGLAVAYRKRKLDPAGDYRRGTMYDPSGRAIGHTSSRDSIYQQQLRNHQPMLFNPPKPNPVIRPNRITEDDAADECRTIAQLEAETMENVVTSCRRCGDDVPEDRNIFCCNACMEQYSREVAEAEREWRQIPEVTR